MFNYKKLYEIQDFLKKNSKLTKIIAISKNQTKESVIDAIKCGVSIFGENRVQEAINKFKDLKETYPDLELHLTGPLQSNKVKLAIPIFDIFHTLDREKIAREFFKHKNEITNKKFFIQVNTGQEDSKSGIYISYLNEFLNFCQHDMSLNIVGLMCIPPINEDPRIHFKKLKLLAEKNNLNELSIGMSGDYLEALDFNPSYIRLGTILFGKRN
ncbi:YggS family pyridoxal phosphate-dependent enzyme [Pelagibacteraceae bacterium]|nr:YggS family pyridoxal phosphate-dependent enzyme [Pelagibacteraceae bacterium]